MTYLLIHRKYQPLFLEKLEDGQNRTRTLQEEELAQAEYQARRADLADKLAQKLCNQAGPSQDTSLLSEAQPQWEAIQRKIDEELAGFASA